MINNLLLAGSGSGSSSGFLLLLGGSLDVLHLRALLALVHRAAGGVLRLGVGPVLDQGAAGRGLQVHHGATVGDLLGQAAGLQLDALGGPAEGSEGPALAGGEDLALGGGEATAPEI